jgi:2-polyprenyl-3-methyl-5-hydroxy-6-metoxy-1,4-benzoquinol methylase
VDTLQTRHHEPELMDDPSLDRALHLQARTGLARLNTLSGAAHSLLPPLKQLMREKNLTSLKILDIATGAADVPFRLMRVAAREGLNIQVDGCDFSETALQQARESAKQRGLKSQFFPLDVLKSSIPPEYDVVMCSLFTHHLDDAENIALLRSMQQAAKHMVIVSDLQRSRVNHALIWLACRLVTTSPVVHFDGPASVRNSYTAHELSRLSKEAGMHGAQVQQIFPCRMMLVWRKD